jgi:O-antigen/teichoic acid export membrane protein
VNAARTTITSGLSTVLTLVTGIVAIGLTARYLGTERYGLWLTISALLSWLAITDFGVGNALMNRLAERGSQDRSGIAQYYVASAFWLLCAIGLLVALIGIVLALALPWSTLLNVKSPQAVSELVPGIIMAFVVYAVGFPFSITNKIYSGYQQGYYINLWNIAASFLSLLALVITTQAHGGLPVLVLAAFGARQLVLGLSTVFVMSRHPDLAPEPRRVGKSYLRQLLVLGGMFIALQASALLLNQTDNILIARALGPESVAIYGTCWRLFSYILMLQGLFLSPLWPAYGEAYARQDIHWIRRTLRLSVVGSLIVTISLCGVLILLVRDITRLWVGAAFIPPMRLVLGVALLQVIRAWTEPFVIFLNGISRLRAQMIYGLGTAVLSLVLRVLLVNRLGLEGVIFGTVLAYLALAAWLLPLDSLRALKALQNDRQALAVEA